jgi:hypothetical protein
MAMANSFDKRFSTARYGGRWDRVVNVAMSQQAEFYSQLDERASWFYEAVGLSEGMTTHTPGEGQAYLSTYRDKAGAVVRRRQGLSPARAARGPGRPVVVGGPLRHPDPVFHGHEVRHRRALVARCPGQEPDGSVDLVFAPEPPKDSPESNWIPTLPGRAWFTYFRLYAPLQPYFDASWRLPDIEAA